MTEMATTHRSQIGETLWRIHVNREPVDMDDQLVTGLEIKKAAIRQGVHIELDFQLTLVGPDGTRQVVGDSETVDVRARDVFLATAAAGGRWVIYVNRRPVDMDEQMVTGLVIKEAAIAQGISIRLDFQLAAVDADGRHQIIGDSDQVDVRESTTFFATAGDDNS